MLLYIIRHAQSENNALWAATGTSEGRKADPGLTDIGHRQAELVAEHLANAPDIGVENYFAERHNLDGYNLTHLYTSLMIRSIMTATYIGRATGLAPMAWPEIHERGGLHHESVAEGEVIAGPGRSYFEETHPELQLPSMLSEAGWWRRPQETVEQALVRAHDVWLELHERHGGTDDRVALVTHGGFFQSLLSVLSSRAHDPERHPLRLGDIWFGISNASISRIELANDQAVIRYTNRVSHLPPELVTG